MHNLITLKLISIGPPPEIRVPDFVAAATEHVYSDCITILLNLEMNPDVAPEDVQSDPYKDPDSWVRSALRENQINIYNFTSLVKTILVDPETVYDLETFSQKFKLTSEKKSFFEEVFKKRKDEIGSMIVQNLKSKLDSKLEGHPKETYEKYIWRLLKNVHGKKPRRSDIGVLNAQTVRNENDSQSIIPSNMRNRKSK